MNCARVKPLAHLTIIGTAVGMGIALFMLMNILNMDMIMPRAPIQILGFSV